MNNLKYITKYYFAMIPTSMIDHEKYVDHWEDVTWDLQTQLMKATVLHPCSLQRPPRLQYSINFIKFVIKQLEEHGVEINDVLYDTLGELMGQPEPPDFYKTYILENGQLLSIRESHQLVTQGTTGLRTWQAAQYLAEWAMENTSVFQHKRVLELGSGLGLTGLVIHKTCEPQTLMLSDCHAAVLNLLCHNIDCNVNEQSLDSTHSVSPSDIEYSANLDIWTPNQEHWTQVREISPTATRWQSDVCTSLQVVALDWEQLSEKGQCAELLGEVEIIIAADVVYDLSIIPALVRVLNTLLSQGNSPKAYIASTIRNMDTRDVFLKKLGEHSISHSMITGPSKEVFVYDKKTPIELLLLQKS